MSDVLIKADGVSKKFCKDLKRSMIYGVQDISKSLIGITPKTTTLKEKEFWAVNDISFELKRGQCLGLIGPNGSGKSTLLKMLNGIIEPDKGQIQIKGKVGALIEVGAGFHPMLTGRENIYINGSILGLSKKEIDRKFDAIVDFAELDEFIDTPVKLYSSGMYVRLGFAIAAQIKPDILLIDEVLAVGDIAFRVKCFNAILETIKNSAVIFVSHAMPDVNRICSDICVLKKGKASMFKQVSKGIESYLFSFNPDKNIIIGNGKVKIHSVTLESNGKKNISLITYSEELIINFELTIDRSILYPSLGVTLSNIDDYTIIQCNSFYNKFQFRNRGHRMKISVNLGKTNLNPGIYYISMGVQAERFGEVLTRFINFKSLQVTGHFIGSAPIQIEGEWSKLQ